MRSVLVPIFYFTALLTDVFNSFKSTEFTAKFQKIAR
jgi:hypothetical protein